MQNSPYRFHENLELYDSRLKKTATVNWPAGLFRLKPSQGLG